jgi:hypothetical protein
MQTGSRGPDVLVLIPLPACRTTAIEYAVLNPDENARSYSSVWDNNAIGTGHARSMLDSPQAWVPSTNTVGQTMTIALGSAQTVVGVVTQGRAECCPQWVSSYTVQASQDCVSYSAVDSGRVFAANSDNPSKVAGFFATPVQASCIRLVPQTWSQAMSMRAAVLIPNCSSSFETGYDFQGSDLESGRPGINSITECALLCGRTSGCQSFTYGKNPSIWSFRHCFMKRAVKPGRTASDCCDGGLQCIAAPTPAPTPSPT